MKIRITLWLSSVILMLAAHQAYADQFTYSDGTKYDGQMENGAPNGYGIITWTNGKRYEGMVSNGQQHGKGAYYNPSGYKEIGEYVNGKKHGQCKIIYPDGGYTIGEFRDGQQYNAKEYNKDGILVKLWNNGVATEDPVTKEYMSRVGANAPSATDTTLAVLEAIATGIAVAKQNRHPSGYQIATSSSTSNSNNSASRNSNSNNSNNGSSNSSGQRQVNQDLVNQAQQSPACGQAVSINGDWRVKNTCGFEIFATVCTTGPHKCGNADWTCEDCSRRNNYGGIGPLKPGATSSLTGMSTKNNLYIFSCVFPQGATKNLRFDGNSLRGDCVVQ